MSTAAATPPRPDFLPIDSDSALAALLVNDGSVHTLYTGRLLIGCDREHQDVIDHILADPENVWVIPAGAGYSAADLGHRLAVCFDGVWEAMETRDDWTPPTP